MTERLPRHYFHDLSRSIWNLGQTCLAGTLPALLLPARVTCFAEEGAVSLELSFTIDKPPQSKDLPRAIGMTIFEAEVYRPDSSLTMYPYKKLTLHTRNGRSEFVTGVVVENEAIIIEPLFGKPAPGMPYRPGDTAWQQVASGNAGEFDEADAQYFLDVSEKAYRSRQSL